MLFINWCKLNDYRKKLLFYLKSNILNFYTIRINTGCQKVFVDNDIDS